MLKVVLVAAVVALVTATPMERVRRDVEALSVQTPADISSMQELVQTLKEVAVAEKTGQQQLMATLQSISDNQVNIQRFLVGSTQIDFSSNQVAPAAAEAEEGTTNEVEASDNMRYFTSRVVAALNAGNNTQLSEILVQLKEINSGFKKYFRKVDCPEPFVSVGDSCYNFQLEDLPWEESRQRCLRLGAELAEPKDLTVLRLYISENFPRKSRRNFWIGGINNNKVWEWLSGSPLPTDHWYTNEPSGNGECLAMFDGWERPLTDFPCENPRRAVCEKRAVTA